ncbi:hypothetical protein HA42_22215 [Pantoea deleyi]|uniref:DUF924 domain-containing protein n=1 Tax=Pantoea deleyi TaxID=470932 RepID=A0A506QHI4_9GAMM|nr:DUF924 family protein [Pantoea deleyi]ORM72632.1 hypothetical protein HA42_22215 [Pantoea deleyi]TPV45582.1 DUF924 domain-containing protein [Pantoea deleyi]
MDYEDVLNFWFSKASQDKWFVRDEQFDKKVSARFRTHWEAAYRGEYYTWRESIKGRLAEIILLDQFSRNLNRNSPDAWAHDNMALVLSQEAINRPEYPQLSIPQRAFLLMPWMHSESSLIHVKATELFEELGDPNFIRHQQEHRAIIVRFGRYPHRNQLLGRASSRDELNYLSKL